jgi:hypothetical protein
MLLIMQFRLICVQNDISLWFQKKINYKTYPLGNEPCIGLRMNSSISSPLVAKASSIVRIRGGVCNPT